jgi:hypothetical protein
MNIFFHLFIGIGGGILIYLFTSSLEAAILTLLGAIFIDLDHGYEYWKYKRRFPKANWREFFQAAQQLQLPSIYIFLHSYELVLILTPLFYFLMPYLLPLLFGINLHLLFDLSFNPLRWYSYFFLYRLKVKFDSTLLRL